MAAHFWDSWWTIYRWQFIAAIIAYLSAMAFHLPIDPLYAAAYAAAALAGLIALVHTAGALTSDAIVFGKSRLLLDTVLLAIASVCTALMITAAPWGRYAFSIAILLIVVIMFTRVSKDEPNVSRVAILLYSVPILGAVLSGIDTFVAWRQERAFL